MNSIDTMFEWNFHFVSRTEGEISYSHVSAWRAGSRSMPRSKRSGEDRKIQASEQNHADEAPTCISQCVRHWFHLGTSSFFSNVFGGASARATVTSSRRRAGVFNEGRAASLEKLPASCSRFQAWSCDSLRHRSRSGRTRALVRDTVFDMAAGNTWHCQQERVINDVALMWTRGVGLPVR